MGNNDYFVMHFSYRRMQYMVEASAHAALREHRRNSFF